MSAPIGSSTTAGSAQTRVGSSAGASGVSSGGSRPQVQSRRVSLKLGPLGITYSTDKVLWTEAVAAAAASAVGAEQALTADKALSSDEEPVDPVRGLPGSGRDAGLDAGAAAQQTAQQEAAAAGRSFHLELAEAWRKQIEARSAASQTYGPDGAPRPGAVPSAATTATLAETNASASTAASAAPTAGMSASTAAASSGASSTTSSPTASAAPNTTAPPAARMRRAIGAYLACAREFSAARPMLTAVA